MPKITIKQICKIYDVPVELVGDREHSTYRNNQNRLNMVILEKIFWQSAYPVYSIANMADCGEHTIYRMIKKYMATTHKINGTVFVSRVEIIKLFSLPFLDCQKYLYNIKQKLD